MRGPQGLKSVFSSNRRHKCLLHPRLSLAVDFPATAQNNVNMSEIYVDISENFCITNRMVDEAAMKMFESARERLKELLRQETEIKNQISHWGPIIEQLARLIGETID